MLTYIVSVINSNPLAPVIFGCIGGAITNFFLQRRQLRHNYFCQQLVHIYGPVYAQIMVYDSNIKIIAQIQKNIWHDKRHDFLLDTSNKDDTMDDYEIMAEIALKESFNCSEIIYNILTSNIAYANKQDIQSIESFLQNYVNHINSYGSCESPPLFSNCLESTKIPDDFRISILNSYQTLLEKIKW